MFRAPVETIPLSLTTAVGISVVSHLAVYGLTPVLSLHLVALGGTSTQVGLLFSTFSLVAVVLRPAAGRGSIGRESVGPSSPGPPSPCWACSGFRLPPVPGRSSH